MLIDFVSKDVTQLIQVWVALHSCDDIYRVSGQFLMVVWHFHDRVQDISHVLIIPDKSLPLHELFHVILVCMLDLESLVTERINQKLINIYGVSMYACM